MNGRRLYLNSKQMIHWLRKLGLEIQIDFVRKHYKASSGRYLRWNKRRRSQLTVHTNQQWNRFQKPKQTTNNNNIRCRSNDWNKWQTAVHTAHTLSESPWWISIAINSATATAHTIFSSISFAYMRRFDIRHIITMFVSLFNLNLSQLRIQIFRR